jgi:hypothetical protein
MRAGAINIYLAPVAQGVSRKAAYRTVGHDEPNTHTEIELKSRAKTQVTQYF